MSFYDVIDDYSRKQITVTMTYGIAPLLVSHYMNNVSAPMAGEFNNFVITDFVEGTINLIPRVTPRVDQKKILDDLHVNYLNISSTGQLAVQSTYTSQDHEGPLSYSSNVVVTQSCIKAIRRYVPKIRFMLMEGNDFSKYRQLINDNVIQYYLQYFKSLELIYTADADENIMSAGFYALDKDTSYTLYFVPEYNGVSSLANRVQVATGHFDDAGYYTVPFDGAKAVKEGARFAIVLVLTTPGATHPMAIEYVGNEFTQNVDITDGTGYISSNGLDWESVEDTAKGNLCLKAYGKKIEESK
jgi:hypothetical protein